MIALPGGKAGKSMLTGKQRLEIRSGFTREDLRRIAEDGDDWRLSLYMPLYRTGREVRQAPILLKDLRTRAAAALEARGCDSFLAGELLAPASRIIEDADFSLVQGEGLAILSAGGYSSSFLLPFVPPAMVEVGKRFLLDPLLPLLFEDGRFHLLALSLNSVRLFQADRLRLRELPLEGLAVNMREALALDEPEGYLNNHGSATGPIRDGGAGVFHGHGNGRSDLKDRKRDILEFFRMIDQGMRQRAGVGDQPLLLAGVEYLLPLYREASGHPRLMEQAIPGNPESNFDAVDLHAKAWKAYCEAREQERENLLRALRERLATPRAALGIRAVLPAAAQGRVSHLFLRKGLRQWGSFDTAEQRVRLDDAPGPENEDLANLACMQALLGGAKVYSLDGADLPERAEIAALCRY
jgi:hypothetical protein